MAGNYNIHDVNDDKYYYCPNNDCACHGSADNDYGTRDDDDITASNYHNYCCGHCGAFYNAYDEPLCDDCGAPADFSSSYNFFKSLFPDTLDDIARNYDNNSGNFNGNYRDTYNDRT
jgi:hypothetical protein